MHHSGHYLTNLNPWYQLWHGRDLVVVGPCPTPPVVLFEGNVLWLLLALGDLLVDTPGSGLHNDTRPGVLPTLAGQPTDVSGGVTGGPG